MRRLAIVLAVALLPGMGAMAQSPETWGSIATDGRDNFGIAVGMATREAAEQTALGECLGDCRIRLTGLARCIAFARSDDGNASGFAGGPTREGVTRDAWAECNSRVPSNSCTIRSVRCFE